MLYGWRELQAPSRAGGDQRVVVYINVTLPTLLEYDPSLFLLLISNPCPDLLPLRARYSSGAPVHDRVPEVKR